MLKLFRASFWYIAVQNVNVKPMACFKIYINLWESLRTCTNIAAFTEVLLSPPAKFSDSISKQDDSPTVHSSQFIRFCTAWLRQLIYSLGQDMPLFCDSKISSLPLDSVFCYLKPINLFTRLHISLLSVLILCFISAKCSLSVKFSDQNLYAFLISH